MLHGTPAGTLLARDGPQPLLDAVTATLRRNAEDSAFLRSLRIADRVHVVPRGALVAPIGAALAVRAPVAVVPVGGA
jgi:glucokinase